jgi:hypothetical protein
VILHGLWPAVASPPEEVPVDTSSSEWPVTNTEHGMLVAMGEFLRQHGLLDRLRQVPIQQKAHAFTPQAKLIEFLVGIMSGIEHLHDLNYGPRPLVADAEVATAWGLKKFAHFTTVGRTLDCCDPATVTALEAAITAFSRPFIDAAVHEEVRRGYRVVLDVDLTGRPVSPTSTTFPEAAFGWMNDQVRLGYQLARVCLSPHSGERLWLAGFHHPGDTVSAECLQALVQAAETQLRIRPQRRPELVDQRVAAQRADMARLRRLRKQRQAQAQHAEAKHTELVGKCYHAEQLLKSRLSKAKQRCLRTQLAGWRKRLPRLVEQMAHAKQLVAQYQTRLTEQTAELATLQQWRRRLATDNLINPTPPEIEVRMDAGFASGGNLTWLLEMGYWPNTKSPNGRTTNALRARLPRSASWVRVGENAEMTLIGDHVLHGCPHPLTLAVERFKVKGRFKYASLVRYGPPPALGEWFNQYNARQTIEAGNKELKGPFSVQHLMTRAPAGLKIQVILTGLAANCVRWYQPWLKACAAAPTPSVNRLLDSPKALVRVAANSAALVQRTNHGTSLVFGPRSALPGAGFTLHGVPAIQLPLGYHRPFKNVSQSTKLALNAHSLR